MIYYDAVQVGDYVQSHVTENLFLVVRKDDKCKGILFKSMNKKNHKFRLLPSQYRKFSKVDEADLYETNDL